MQKHTEGANKMHYNVFVTRMMDQTRVILHSDINNCYASIEILQRPELQGKAVAVCGAKEERHGIVLAKSALAKRFGVKTGEAIWQAQQKCPELIIVPPHFELYQEYSQKLRQIYAQYTSQVEPFGLDECWLDITASQNLFGKPVDLAKKIAQKIYAETKLSVSIGISFTKEFAKLASDLASDGSVYALPPSSLKTEIWLLPIKSLIGVGRATWQVLERHGIETIGDLANLDVALPELWLGKNGKNLWQIANGIPLSAVKENISRHIPQSIGNGVTCRRDLLNIDMVHSVLEKLAQKVSSRLRQEVMLAEGVQLTIKRNDLSTLQRQVQLNKPTQSAKLLLAACLELFEASYDLKTELPVRALTIRAINLTFVKPEEQLSLSSPVQSKQEKLDLALYRLQKKFGAQSVGYADQLGSNNLPETDYTIVSLPN